MLLERWDHAATRVSRAIAALIVTVMLTIAFAITAASPASAHDWLIHSDPADGVSLDAAPEQITMSFSGNILELGTEVALLDAETGEYLELPEQPSVAEGTVTQAVVPLGQGAFVLNLRVVSEDGHPVSGAIHFAIGTEVITEVPRAAANGDESESNAGPMMGLLIGAGIVVAAIVVFVIVRASRHSKTADDTASADSVTIAQTSETNEEQSK